jgi:erythronate-4-phosphate dehydrogenase
LKKKLKIIADSNVPFLKGALDSFADIRYLPGKDMEHDQVSNADALIIRSRTKCNRKLLENSNVKFIATATIGYDHIDTQYCEHHGIKWCNAPGCNASSVEQYILSALLIIADKYNFRLSDKTIGILGVGHVGSRIEKVSGLLGMDALLNDPPRERVEGSEKFVGLDRILAEADIITLHVPLYMQGADKTFHLTEKSFFDALSKKVHFLNTSRGEVVHTAALKEAIKNNSLESVILDVWENEPDIDTELLDLVDIATPHIAGYSLDGKANGTMMSVHALSRFFNLRLENWKPENIPVPEKTEINIEAGGKDIQDVLTEAVLRTYYILDDDKRLRKSIPAFEQQRAEYPLRREYGAYTIHLTGDHSNIGQTLKELGFIVI